MHPAIICSAYVLSIGFGWLVAGIGVYLMRRSIGYPREFFRPLDIYVGGCERIVVTTLVMFAPKYVPVFIGGWIVLKFAANWERRTEPKANQASLVALVGSVLSFSAAILAGLIVNPDAVRIWEAP
jgi:hypothetical protein